MKSAKSKPGATVLLTGTDESRAERPMLIFQRYGRGKTFAFLPQDTWVWQMHSSIAVEDLTHENYWRQLMRWLVDASNVIGSKPDGWWHDREAAARRLIDALRRFAGESGDVTLVLDAGPPEWAGREGSLEVVIAPRRGRDAADDEIARRLEADPDPGSIRVVTSDAPLAARARARGAEVVGAGGFRRRLGY